MLEKFEINGDNSGKTFVCLGAVHGNEVCGKLAIQRVLKDIEDKKLKIIRGKVVFVPLCNPAAHEQNTRYIDVNLNRNIMRHTDLSKYENAPANAICDILDEADYLLDLHSSHESDCAYATQDGEDEISVSRAKSLGVKYIITGWPALYGGDASRDTNAYLIRKGLPALTVECGQHDDPIAIQVAYDCIIKSLCHLGFIDPASCKLGGESKTINFTKIVWKEKEGAMVKKWKDFDFVEKGDIIAKYDDGTILSCEESSYIIFPRYDCPVGDEWYYLAS